MHEIILVLQQHKQKLFKKHPIKTMAPFGSYSRGKETPESDVDVMVELNGSMGMKFLNLNYEIENIVKPDLPLFKEKILFVISNYRTSR